MSHHSAPTRLAMRSPILTAGLVAQGHALGGSAGWGWLPGGPAGPCNFLSLLRVTPRL
ncbi:hypothetical protein [Mesorhizobium cantuariense]|uniref:Uncharacterized protein n=1 Tax=Mesorhizobium cantuariense TaxID=1300275 RepID=A0ABV7MH38_9HYPH